MFNKRRVLINVHSNNVDHQKYKLKKKMWTASKWISKAEFHIHHEEIKNQDSEEWYSIGEIIKWNGYPLQYSDYIYMKF